MIAYLCDTQAQAVFMRLRSILIGAFVGMAVLGVTLTPVVATDHFQITSENSQPVPERSVDFRGTTYQVDSFIVADTGEAINVSVTGPDESYRVYVYNSDEQLVDSRAALGNDTFTFDLEGYESGSYAVTVYQAEDYEAIVPLVVEGYDVSVDAPENITADENMSVRINVERNGTDESPAAVNAVISSGGDELVVDAAGSDGEYTAAVEAGSLESGNYTVYGLVQGDEEVFGRNEVRGVSDNVSLSVRNATTTATRTAGATATPTGTAEPTPTPTATATRSGTDETATSTEATTPVVTQTEAAEAEESAITPNADSQPETTSGSGPGFTLALTVAAVALAVVLWRRRD